MGETLGSDLGLLPKQHLRFKNQDAYPKLTHIALPAPSHYAIFIRTYAPPPSGRQAVLVVRMLAIIEYLLECSQIVGIWIESALPCSGSAQPEAILCILKLAPSSGDTADIEALLCYRQHPLQSGLLDFLAELPLSVERAQRK